VKLNLDGLKVLSESMTKSELAALLWVDRSAINRYLAGKQPRTTVVKRINDIIEERVREGPNVREVFAKYLYVWANHRLSIDEGHIGALSACRVLRYPLARAEVCQLYERLTSVLYCDKRHLFDWLQRNYRGYKTILGSMLRQELVLPCPDKVNLCRNSGMDPRWVEAYYMDLTLPENAPFLVALQVSASRDDPEQDGKVKVDLTTSSRGRSLAPEES
jgi:predicted transcriptional regulator